MMTHELARLLLAGPDVRVVIRDAAYGETIYFPVADLPAVRLTRGYASSYGEAPPHACDRTDDVDDCDLCQPAIAIAAG